MPPSKLLNVTRLIRARRERRARQAHSLGRRFARLSIFSFAVLSTAIAVLALGAPALFSYITQDLPSVDSLPQLLNADNGILLNATRIFDRNGELISSLAPAGYETRSYIHLDENPFLLIAFSHYLDPENMEPGSNPGILAKQLVDQLLLPMETEGLRKTLRSNFLSAQSVQRFDSEQLIEWALNSSDFGNRIYGVGDAASYYLSKSLEQANLADLALLAVIADETNGNSSMTVEELRREQQFLLLDLLEQGLITEAQAQAAVSGDIHLNAAAGPTTEQAPYFRDMLLEQLYSQFDEETIWRGGFELTTTLDLSLQKNVSGLAAERDAEIVILDSSSGQILAMVGPAKDASHQAGTILSPFVYLNAFANGYSPASLIWDIPSSILPGIADYENADGKFHGPINLRTALAQNYLVPSMELLSRIGVQRTWQIAQEAGLRSLNAATVEESYEVLLGGVELSLIELAQAYGTLANQGHIAGQDQKGGIQPGTLLIVRDPLGNILLDQTISQSRSIISAELAYLVTDILSDSSVVLENAKVPIQANVNRPAAIQLALSPQGDGVWVLGYSPQLVVAVWASDEESSIAQRGALWSDIFEISHGELPIQSWLAPAKLSTVVVCVPSGMLPSADCPLTRREFFFPGQEPSQLDSLYQRVSINRYNGKLATVFTQADFIEEQVVINLPEGSDEWASRAGLDIPPSDYDVITQSNQSSESVSILGPTPFTSLSGQIRIKGKADDSEAAAYRVLAGEGLFPSQWIEIAQGPIAEDGEILALWDTQSLDGLYAIHLQVISSDAIVQNAYTLVTIDNQTPQLSIITPKPGQEFNAADIDELQFLAEAEDNHSIEKVVISLDGFSIGSITEEPFEITWPIILGDHELRVTAIDEAGNQITEVISFEVSP